MLTRDLPRINTMMNPMNLGCHLLNPKNMLTRVDIRSGPDTFHLPDLWLVVGLPLSNLLVD